MRIKVVAFDADGTLYEVRTKEAYDRMFRFLAEKLGIPASGVKEKFYEILGSIKDSKDPSLRKREYCLRKTLAALGKYDEQLIKDALDLFWNVVLSMITPKVDPKVIEALSQKYVLCVFTDEFRENVERKLNKVFGNWKKFFSFLVTPEDTHEMKPSLKYFQVICSKANVSPSEVVVIGDSLEKDLSPAREFGMTALSVQELPRFLKERL